MGTLYYSLCNFSVNLKILLQVSPAAHQNLPLLDSCSRARIPSRLRIAQSAVCGWHPIKSESPFIPPRMSLFGLYVCNTVFSMFLYIRQFMYPKSFIFRKIFRKMFRSGVPQMLPAMQSSTDRSPLHMPICLRAPSLQKQWLPHTVYREGRTQAKP